CVIIAYLVLFPRCYLQPLHLHSFPTRRSSDLFRDLQSRVIVHADYGIGFRQFRPEHNTISPSIHTTVMQEYIKKETISEEMRLRSEEHTSELQSRFDLVCRLLLAKKKAKI